MKLRSIAITTFALSCLVTKAQTLNGIWNAAKDAAVTNSTTIIDAAKTNTTAANAINTASNVLGGGGTAKPSLTNDEVINGLKEALSVGTNNSSGLAAKADGYLKNPKIFIPWPSEAQDMRAKLVKLGMEKKVLEFETSLNRAAEEAAKKAAPVFLDAIKGMSIGDGFAILNGADSAATHYLREKTFAPLKTQFMPVVKEAIAKVKVTSYWNPLVTKYNKIPGVKKQNPDLNDYVTKKAANGLFVLIADEEAKIRKDPMARVTDLLKKVFGAAK